MIKPPHKLVVNSEPDKDDKSMLTLYWMDDFHPGNPEGEDGLRERGQVFRINLEEAKERWPTAKVIPFSR